MKACLNAVAAVVIASHDAGLLRSVCNKGVLLRGGRLLEFGPIDAVLESHRNASGA